jgi:hypothetical protein
MPIPPLTEHGFLPEGVHECTLSELDSRFGGGHPSRRRHELYRNLVRFLSDFQILQISTAVYINGSFITGKSDPNDIDLIVDLGEPSQRVNSIFLEMMREERVKLEYQIDLYAVPKLGGRTHSRILDLFQSVRLEDAIRLNLDPNVRKGLIRLTR